MPRSISVKIPDFPLRRVVFIAALVIAAIVVFNWQFFYTLVRYPDPNEREANRIALRLAAVAELPAGSPGLATVDDETKINRGGVLADARNGDKVLLYYSAGKAVLYRPGTDKVVAIGPIVLDASANQVKDTRILVRNGSGQVAKLESTIELLNERYSEAKLLPSDQASRTDFPKTIVIDLSENGEKNEFVGAIMELLGAQRGVLPQGESRPDADVLVIVGQDN